MAKLATQNKTIKTRAKITRIDVLLMLTEIYFYFSLQNESCLACFFFFSFHFLHCRSVSNACFWNTCKAVNVRSQQDCRDWSGNKALTNQQLIVRPHCRSTTTKKRKEKKKSTNNKQVTGLPATHGCTQHCWVVTRDKHRQPVIELFSVGCESRSANSSRRLQIK